MTNKNLSDFIGATYAGYTGSKGDPGGYTGSSGAGYTGSQGDLGYTGSVGVGYTGSQGIIGYTGSVPSAPFDLVIWQQGKPAAGQTLLRAKMARTIYYESNFNGSTYSAPDYTATSSAVFSVQKNGSQIGTITYDAGLYTATFATSGTVTFSAGDILSVVAPASQDATLEGISIILVGTR